MNSFRQPYAASRADGFTIVEVVVAALIFALAVTGVFSAIGALRGPAVASKEDITAAFVGKQVLEDLRTEVDAETWTTGSLANGNYTLPAVTVDGVAYTPSYLVTNDPGGTQAKKVDLTITW